MTGGTDSFGTAFLKKTLDNNDFSQIRVFSRNDKNLKEFSNRILK